MSYLTEVLADAPQAVWPLDEAGGATAYADASGNGRGGSVTYGVFGQPQVIPTASGTCAATSRTSYGVGVSTGDGAWANAANFTEEAWCKPITTGGTLVLIQRSGRTTLRINADKAEFQVFNTAGTPTTAVGATTLSPNQTYHLVGVFDGSSVKVYVNGALDGEVTFSSVMLTGGSVYVRLGERDGGFNPFDGPMSYPAVYNTVLSATRIAAHYSAGTGVAGPVTVAGSVANVVVGAHAGSVVVPTQVSGGTANVAVTAHAGLLASPVTVSGLAANVAVAGFAGSAVSGVGVVPIETSTRYANDGYSYDGTAAVYFEPPIAEPPAHIRRVKVSRVHQSMSAPNLVNGVPR